MGFFHRDSLGRKCVWISGIPVNGNIAEAGRGSPGAVKRQADSGACPDSGIQATVVTRGGVISDSIQAGLYPRDSNPASSQGTGKSKQQALVKARQVVAL